MSTASDDNLESQRLDTLADQARSTSLVAIAMATLVLGLFATHQPGFALFAWYATVLATIALRLRILHARHVRPQRLSPAAWDRLIAFSGLLNGVAWGALPLANSQHGNLQFETLEYVIPMLIATGAIHTYATVMHHYHLLLLGLFTSLLLSLTIAHQTAILPDLIMVCGLVIGLHTVAKKYLSNLIMALQANAESKRLLVRLQTVNEKLSSTNATLAQQQATIAHEDELAAHVFQQLTTHTLAHAGIHTWNEALGRLSGDLIQQTLGPQGQTYVMLGDFTGHGLPAALGAVPASGIFRTMAAKGLGVEMIASELHSKLGALLPTGYFCCAVLLQLSPQRDRVHVWNGGLPPVLIHNQTNATLTRLPSRNLPLGVGGEEAFSANSAEHSLTPGDVIYVYSDGLTEACNSAREQWGIARLEGFLLHSEHSGSRLDELNTKVMAFVDTAPASDDISVVEIVVDDTMRTN